MSWRLTHGRSGRLVLVVSGFASDVGLGHRGGVGARVGLI